jgi:glycosyltransferase involved in cell wall biosynthesis
MVSGRAADASIDLVLPCLDEAAALPWVLDRVPDGVRAIVVDNGSRDGSAEVASTHGAMVVHEGRPGYGSACHAGLTAATADVVAFLDADGSLDPADLPLLLAPLITGAVDLAVGRRRTAVRSAWPWHLRLANIELARRVRRRTGLTVRDVGPGRAAWREPLLALGIEDRRSGYPVETLVRAADAGWRVAAVDLTYHPRTGRSKVTGTPLGAARAVRDMSRVLSR